ncbi:hypothetical protein AVEN_12314-1 [Araneus ventricosus]|uniref:Uncharacterized protein n=1 Tax=Araneus ventricosus TaxID=182803 RepID=A0A4Y2EAQ2_ARAVE|nr:hypothetical protein AVEN_12314-1 [Araneus ventricosus]
MHFNPLIPKATEIKGPQNTECPISSIYKGDLLCPSKTTMTAGIVRKLPSSPNTSGRSTVTKKARTACVKSITNNERVRKFQSDIRSLRDFVVFCLKGRMGRSRIDRVKSYVVDKCPPAGVMRKLGDGGVNSGVFLVI